MSRRRIAARIKQCIWPGCQVLVPRTRAGFLPLCGDPDPTTGRKHNYRNYLHLLQEQDTAQRK